MADLNPEDIKDPDEYETKRPGDDEPEPEPEEPEPEPDKVVVVCGHLADAVAELARSAGSPPAAMAALEKVREVLAKRS